MKVQKNMTLEEMVLQKQWKTTVPSTDGSRVERQIYLLSQKADKDFSIEDLRFIILQEIGLSRYIPMAIQKLEDNIFAEGDFYEGDLLSAVLQVSDEYWKSHNEERVALARLLANMSESQHSFLDNELPHQLGRLVNDFLNRYNKN